DRKRVGGVAPFGGAWGAVWGGVLATTHGSSVRFGVVPAEARPTKESQGDFREKPNLTPFPPFYDSPGARPFQAAPRQEVACFLALYERLLERFRPDLVLTYGGDWVAQEIMAQAKRRTIPVVFALHNFAYQGAELFRPVDAVLVPSRFAQAHYRRTLGL